MIEVRTCESETSEVAAFTTRVWRETFRGRRLAINWDTAYFDWQLFNGVCGRDYLLAAYDGTRLVGTLFAEPFRLSVRGVERDATMSSWLTVEPEYRRNDVASMLVAEMRRRHRERNAAFQIGFGVLGTMGPQFWRTMPDAFILRKLGFWCLMSDVNALRESLYLPALGRSAMRLLRVVERASPRAPKGEGIRTYAPTDLPRCLELANALGEGMDMAYRWEGARLGLQLQHKGQPRTLVYKEGGRVEGFINYYVVECVGRSTVRTAIIDIFACGAAMSSRERTRLLQAGVAGMAEEGCVMALLLRIPCYPAATLLKSGFIPLPQEFSVICGWPEPGLPLEGVKRLYLHLR